MNTVNINKNYHCVVGKYKTSTPQKKYFRLCAEADSTGGKRQNRCLNKKWIRTPSPSHDVMDFINFSEEETRFITKRTSALTFGKTLMMEVTPLHRRRYLEVFSNVNFNYWAEKTTCVINWFKKPVTYSMTFTRKPRFGFPRKQIIHMSTVIIIISVKANKQFCDILLVKENL